MLAAALLAAACGRSAEPAPEGPSVQEALEAAGYLDGYESPTAPAGVTVVDRARIQPGVNLVVSAHHEGAELIDADGNVLHRWTRRFAELWPGATELVPEENGRRWLDWRTVTRLPDGDLVGIYEGFGSFRLGPDGAVRWALPNRAHHDVELAPDGTLWTLDRALRQHDVTGPRPVLVDSLVRLDGDGRELQRIDLLAALQADARLVSRVQPGTDPLHANAVRVLDGTGAERVPALARGQLLVSLRNLDAIVTVDPDRGVITRSWIGPWSRQHDPWITPDGHLLLFDNRGNGGFARALELDPATGTVVWAWPAAPDPEFRSPLAGTVQRLANGNTLLVASTIGRAVEVTRAGEVVWRYDNPGRTPAGRTAMLLQVERVPQR